MHECALRPGNRANDMICQRIRDIGLKMKERTKSMLALSSVNIYLLNIYFQAMAYPTKLWHPRYLHQKVH
jgi:hypothetical protein